MSAALEIRVSADSSVDELYVDGVSYTASLQHATTAATLDKLVDISVLQAAHVVAIKASNQDGSTAGLIASLSTRAQPSMLATGGASGVFYTATDPGASWYTVGFDDAAFTAPSTTGCNMAVPTGANGAAWVWPAGCSDGTTTAWFRLKFTVVQVQPTYTLSPPDDNTTVAAGRTTVTMTFSEHMEKGAGLITVEDQSDITSYTIDVNSTSVVISGAVVTITLNSPLVAGRAYQILVPSTCFHTFSDVYFAGVGASGWTFTVLGGAAPTVDSLSPTNKNNDVPVSVGNMQLVLTFTESVLVGNGNIVFKQYKDNTAYQYDVTSASNIVVSGKVVTITVPQTVAGSNYTVTVPNTAYFNRAGKFFAGLREDDWTFVTRGAVAPTVLFLSPADNSYNVSTEYFANLTFSEHVRKGTGDIVIVNETDHKVITLPVQSPLVDVSGGGVTFGSGGSQQGNVVTFRIPLVRAASYYVRIAPTAFESFAGNAFAGFNYNDVWNWAMVGSKLASYTLTPANNARGVAPGTTELTIVFSENMEKGTGDIVVFDESDNTKDTISVNSSSVVINRNVVTITISQLVAGKAYHVLAHPRVFHTFADVDFFGFGGFETGEWGWGFHTSGGSPPTAVFYPANEDKTVPHGITQLNMTFSEYPNARVGTITVRDLRRGTSVVYNVTTSGNVLVDANVVRITVSPLLPGTNYSVEVTPFAFSGKTGLYYKPVTWSFVTLGAVNPTVTTFVPANNARNVNMHTYPTLVFSEYVRKGTGNIVLVNETDGRVITYPVQSPVIAVSGTNVTIQIKLSQLAAYYVHVAPTAFESFGGLTYAGFSDNNDWHWTTAPALEVKISADTKLVDVILDGVKVINALPNAYASSVVDVVSELHVLHGSHVLAVRAFDSAGTSGLIAALSTKAQPSLLLTGGPTTSSNYIKTVASGTAFSTSPCEGGNCGEIYAIPDKNCSIFDRYVPCPPGSLAVNNTALCRENSTVCASPESCGRYVKCFNGTVINGQPYCQQNKTITCSPYWFKASYDDSAWGTPNSSNCESLSVPALVAGAKWVWPGGCVSGVSSAWFRFHFSVDVIKPTYTLSPTDNNLNVTAGTTQVTMTFSEHMEKGTGLITVHDDSDLTSYTIDVNDTKVVIVGAVVTITLNTALVPHAYHITMPSTCFRTFSDVYFAGIDAEGWTFGVLGALPPTATLNPANRATNVAAGTTNFTLTFSEAVLRGHGTIVYKQYKDAITSTISVTDTARVHLVGKVVTLEFPSTITGSNYTIVIPSTAFFSKTGKFYAGTTEDDWTFISTGAVAPTATFAPVDNTHNVSVSVLPTITFSEHVRKGTGNIVIVNETNHQVITLPVQSPLIDITGGGVQHGSGQPQQGNVVT